MNNLRALNHELRVVALSRRPAFLAALDQALAPSGASFDACAKVAALDTRAHERQLTLIDAESIDDQREVVALTRWWSESEAAAQPPLVLVGATRPTDALRRYALRILPWPLQAHDLLEALEAAQTRIDQQQEFVARLADSRAALRQRDEFLAMLAHEVRNPLSTIQNVVDSLGLGVQTTGATTALLTRQVSHLSRLLDSLYDFTYVSGGGLELRHEELDLREVLAHALEMVDGVLRGKDQTAHVQTEADPVTVIGDRARLVQVLANVFDNAAKYSAAGQSVHAQVYHDGPWAVVRVQDFGEGLDADDLTRVFEPFVQRNSERASRRFGLGLGLAIVRRLVSLHGGSVHASSDGRGRGSCFEIRLPRAG